MKLFLVIYDVAFDEDVMEGLEASAVTGFTKWDRVLGKGPNSSPKMDNAVWPGFNCAVAVAVDEQREESALAALRTIARRLEGAGIKIYELPARQVS
ncbi:MAG: transcriptional regulator [Deltaproteobacteria bacterium]|nr:transcriptional regulator [Deltaproteobacteria bacterium]MBW2143685.1 transcriptional regulator [Deltaproteobacteria bacterium]